MVDPKQGVTEHDKETGKQTGGQRQTQEGQKQETRKHDNVKDGYRQDGPGPSNTEGAHRTGVDETKEVVKDAPVQK